MRSRHANDHDRLLDSVAPRLYAAPVLAEAKGPADHAKHEPGSYAFTVDAVSASAQGAGTRGLLPAKGQIVVN